MLRFVTWSVRYCVVISIISINKKDPVPTRVLTAVRVKRSVELPDDGRKKVYCTLFKGTAT